MNVELLEDVTALITLRTGEVLEGDCTFQNREFCYEEYGIDEACVQVGNCMIPAGMIKDARMIYDAVMAPLGEYPEYRREALLYLSGKGVQVNGAIEESMQACVSAPFVLPQWYVLLKKDQIRSVCGILPGISLPQADPKSILVSDRRDAAFLIHRAAADLTLRKVREIGCPKEMKDALLSFGWKESDPSAVRRIIRRQEMNPMLLDENPEIRDRTFTIRLMMRPEESQTHASMLS